MICPNCGKENEASCVFCARCGKRLDGKKACRSCGKLIPEDATYCSFCGASVNGDKICRTCGKPYTGNFCPPCGVRSGRTLKSYSFGIGAPWQKLAKTFIFIAACLLLISSFLVGYHATLTAEAKRQCNSATEIARAQEEISSLLDCPTLFHYTEGRIREIIDAANSLPKKPSSLQIGDFATLVIRALLCIVIAVVNIAFAVGCFFHVMRHVIGGDDALDGMEVCLKSVAFSMLTATVFSASYYPYQSAYYNYGQGVYGTVSVRSVANIGASLPYLFTFIPAVILLVCAVVFSAIDDGMYRDRFSSVLLTVTNVFGVILSGALLRFSVGDIAFRATNGNGTISVSSLSLFHTIFRSGIFDSKTLTQTAVMTDISFGLTLLSVLFAALLLRIILSDFLIPDRKRVSVASIILSFVLFLLGSVKIYCDAVIAGNISSASIDGAPIALTLLALLLFAVLLTVRIIKRDSYDIEG